MTAYPDEISCDVNSGPSPNHLTIVLSTIGRSPFFVIPTTAGLLQTTEQLTSSPKIKHFAPSPDTYSAYHATTAVTIDSTKSELTL